MRKIPTMLWLLAILMFIATGLIVFRRQTHPTNSRLYTDAALKKLPQKDASQIDTSHLAQGMMPPTNKWFSGIALQQQPKTVFPTPLNFTPTANAFTFDLPGVHVLPDVIGTKVSNPITVSIAGATSYRVTRYDDVSVDLTYRNATQDIGTVTIVAGLPYIYFHGKQTATLSVPLKTSTSGDALSFVSGDTKSFIVPFDGAKITRGSTEATISVPPNGLVTIYATNDDRQEPAPYAGNRVTGATVSYRQEGAIMKTAIEYKTANGKPTYYGTLPHQQGNDAKNTHYATIYGPLTMHAGNTLNFTTPTITVLDTLDLSRLTTEQKSLLAQTVRQDSNTTKPYPEDTYFGGKALYRDAQLLQLAQQLGETAPSQTIKTRLRAELSAWFDSNTISSKYFYYDSKAKGIVGEKPSFGSDAFNDHHFHYGYFIYAASILSQYDADFRTSHQDAINAVVADIANYASDDMLPQYRAFDPYFGHSWASGSAPFADGNNQESSSEAINAWIATSLWAKQTGNETLAKLSGWMLSNEAAAADAYWLKFDTTKPPYSDGYNHKIVSLNWGGKRDYATFFSSDPRAMLGILLIPMSPTMQYQALYGQRIADHITEARTSTTPSQFDDYILMYESLGSISDQLERAKKLPDSIIDGANSRSYMYAWILSRQQ